MRYPLLLVITLVIFMKSPAIAFDDNVDEDLRNLPIKERFFIGISAGLSFSSFETSIVISPSIGFRFTNRLMAGVGGTYQYYNDRSFGSVFNTHIYGWSVFSRFVVYKGLFVHGEFESLNMNSRDFQNLSPARIWENNYLLGPGYRVRVGRKSYFNLMVLYNFNTTSQIYFQNPIFRFNFEIGL